MIYRVLLDGNDILNYQERPFVLLTPTLDMELNTAGSFEFTMPPSHAFYHDVRLLVSTIEIYEDGTLLWFGRPVEVKTDFYKQKTVYCEGALAFFNDTVQRLQEYDRIPLHSFFQTVIGNHNAQVDGSRQFTVGRVTVPDKTVYRKLNYDSTFDCLKRQCLNAEGGYLFVRREDGVNYIDWLAEMPYTCNQPVEFGLNLLDITSDLDGSSIATCVLPLGDTVEETGEPLTVAEINDGSDVVESEAVAEYGRITRCVTFSGVKEPETLYEDALEYLQDKQFDDLVIECSAAEVHSENENYEQFRIGQVIHCRSIPHLVDREFPLMKLSIQLDTAAKQITLGSARKQTLTEIQKETADATPDNIESMVNDAVSDAMDDVQDEIADLRDGLQEEIDTIIDGMGFDAWEHWVGTLAEYNALADKEDNTIYFVYTG